MSDTDLGQLLRSITGLSVESIGADTVRRIAERRMREVGVKKLTDYLALVMRSEVEKQALIDDVTVPETWFFRDHEPFKYLVQFVRKLRSASSAPTKPIRILSVPCSTGEEPYSIAMMLLDAGFDKESIQIHAVDISKRVIEKAKIGVYGANSFRGNEVAFRNKHFTKHDERYSIADGVKQMVHFSNKNILAPGFMSGHAPFDVVLCRNLLIYFDLETKIRVLTTLHEHMADNSLLVLGHAETGRMAEGLFESVRQSGTFAYRRIEAGAKPVTAALNINGSGAPTPKLQPKPSPKAGAAPTPLKQVLPRKKAAASKKRPALKPGKTANIKSLDEIQSMADQGRLDEALMFVDEHLDKTPDSAQAYYLKGVISLALDADAGAVDAFKKALYLDPKHYQALINLAVLAEEAGEVKQAETYRARAERLNDSGME